MSRLVDKGSDRVDHVNCARHTGEIRNFLLGRSPEHSAVSSKTARIAGYFCPIFYLFRAVPCVFDPPLTNPRCPESWASTDILPWFYAMPSAFGWLGGVMKTNGIVLETIWNKASAGPHQFSASACGNECSFVTAVFYAKWHCGCYRIWKYPSCKFS